MITITKSLVYAAYLLTLAYLVFIGGDSNRQLDLFAFDHGISILPFKDKLFYFTSGNAWNARNLYFFLEEFLGNLVLFVPFSLILMLGEGAMNTRKIVLTAFYASLSIEVIQYITGLGHADMDDLILNTFGAFVGIKLAHWIKKRNFWHPVALLLSLPQNIGWKQLKVQYRALRRAHAHRMQESFGKRKVTISQPN